MSETSSIKWEAAQWIERRIGDEEFDETGFEAWLADDPRRQPVFDTMWRRVMGSDMDVALNVYNRRGATTRALVAGGAAFLLIAVGGYQAMPWVGLRLAQPQEFAVADGKVREVILADGTRLTLAGGAEVEVRYTRHDRVVGLTRGTIFANVAHDERRPFRVETGDARIVDIGTSFEIVSKPRNIRVTVATGVVQFGKKGWFSKPINLTAKQAAILDRKGLNRIADVSPDSVANWRSEWVEYKGAPLRRVIADLQSLSPLPIEIADESLTNKPVSGRIRLTDPVGQLQNLSITHSFHIRHTADALVMSKN